VGIVIRWIALKNICDELVGHKQPVHLHASTDMPDDHIAGVEFSPNQVDIILNMALTKSEDMIIKALAHEMTHVLNGDQDHKINFDEQCLITENRIRERYERL
jgi:hypothetical protein